MLLHNATLLYYCEYHIIALLVMHTHGCEPNVWICSSKGNVKGARLRTGASQDTVFRDLTEQIRNCRNWILSDSRLFLWWSSEGETLRSTHKISFNLVWILQTKIKSILKEKSLLWQKGNKSLLRWRITHQTPLNQFGLWRLPETSLQLLQLFSRMPQRCFAVKPQKCFVDCTTEGRRQWLDFYAMNCYLQQSISTSN